MAFDTRWQAYRRGSKANWSSPRQAAGLELQHRTVNGNTWLRASQPSMCSAGRMQHYKVCSWTSKAGAELGAELGAGPAGAGAA